MKLLFALINTPTLSHRCKFSDLIPWCEVPRLHRAVHFHLLLLGVRAASHRSSPSHIGIIMIATTRMATTGPRCLIHLIVLAALSDQVAEAALTLALVVRVATHGCETRLLLQLLMLVLFLEALGILVASTHSNVCSCLAGASGTGASALDLLWVEAVIRLAALHIAIAVLALLTSLVVELLVAIIELSIHVVHGGKLTVALHGVLLLVVHFALVCALLRWNGIAIWCHVLGSLWSTMGHHLIVILISWHRVSSCRVLSLNTHRAWRLASNTIASKGTAIEAWAPPWRSRSLQWRHTPLLLLRHALLR